MVKHIKQNKEVISFITLFLMLCSLTGLMLHFQVERTNPGSVVYAASGNPTPTPTPNEWCAHVQSVIQGLNNNINTAKASLDQVISNFQSSCGTSPCGVEFDNLVQQKLLYYSALTIYVAVLGSPPPISLINFTAAVTALIAARQSLDSAMSAWKTCNELCIPLEQLVDDKWSDLKDLDSRLQQWGVVMAQDCSA